MNNKQEIDNFLDAFKIMRSNLRSLTMDLFKDSEYTLPQLTVIAILAENGPLKATQISKMAGLA
ncbi:MAG: hypothetical protein GY756_05345, partial [bacterium]|nr:hypothetical protein [bacterium]